MVRAVPPIRPRRLVSSPGGLGAIASASAVAASRRCPEHDPAPINHFEDGVHRTHTLGLKELRNALNPSRESVADQEIGLYGTLTQGEIAQARGGPGQGAEQESPRATLSLDDLRAYAKELSQAEERGREQGKEQGKEQGQERDRGGHEM
jgi:hypothetical protein